jgi:sulfite reductase alpha subunit-like flavoprotein
MNHRITTYASIALSILLLSGCESLSPAVTVKDTSTVIAQTDSMVSDYLDMLAKLSGTDLAQQSDTFYSVEQSNLQAPTTMNQLRYAIALALPGHPASDPVRAKRLIEQLLINPEKLSLGEVAISKTMLNIAEQSLKLQAETRRLVATVDDRTRSQSNSERRLQALSDELIKTRKALDAAQQKLDAIKDIEKSISERSITPLGTRDSGNRDTTSQTQATPAGR